jgi:bifunctional ADP-heptose synthase (sugar kinase/adenylyltransferase)
VTKNQTYRLSHDMGLTAEEIGKLDKGHASLVVDALLKDSPAKAREVYDIQVAAMGAVIGGAANAARPNQPPPVQRGPEAGHSR